MKNKKDITKKWWIYLLIVLAQMLILPFASKNFSFAETSNIITFTLSRAIMNVYLKDFFLFFQLISLLFIFLTFVLKNSFSRIFNIYVCISYFVFAVVQNVAITEKYGLSIVSINLIMFVFVGYFWLREIFQKQNKLNFNNLNFGTIWMLPLAVLAYWMPIAGDGSFAFDLNSFISNGSSLAFCCMTPVYLSILTMNLPSINLNAYRITSFVGIIIGIYNMMNFQNPKLINLAILHLPLLIISTYSFIISFSKKYNQ